MEKTARKKKKRETISKETYPHPIWTLCTKTEALQTETNTSLASTGLIGLLVAFLMTGDEMRDGEDGDRIGIEERREKKWAGKWEGMGTIDCGGSVG